MLVTTNHGSSKRTLFVLRLHAASVLTSISILKAQRDVFSSIDISNRSVRQLVALLAYVFRGRLVLID